MFFIVEWPAIPSRPRGDIHFDEMLGALVKNMRDATYEEEIDAASKGIVVAETLAIVAVSVLVSQFATQTITDLMREEGFEEEEGKEEEVKVIAE